MRRVLAVLGAVAMIVTAVGVRRAIENDDGEDGANADDKVVIMCADDLETYCAAFGDAVEVRVSTAAATAAAIRAGSLPEDVDGWVTSSAWLELLGDDADALGDPERLATSPIGVAALADRAGALDDLCGRQPLWGCLSASAGASWAELGQDVPGRLAVGIPSADTAIGLPVLTSVAAGSLGGVGFASNDFDADFRAQLASLVAASGGTDRDPVRTMVTQRGKYSAAGAPQARVAELRNDAVVLLDASPEVLATIVVVHVRGGDDLPNTGPVRDALVAERWAAANGPDVPLALKDGVMSALHEVWLEAIR